MALSENRKLYTDGTQMSDQDKRLFGYLTWVAVIGIVLLAIDVINMCLNGGLWFAVGLIGFTMTGYLCAEGVSSISDRVQLEGEKK